LVKFQRQLSNVVSAGVAQLVEQLFCKQRVGGSIPLAGLNEATTYRANEMSEYKLSGRIYPERANGFLRNPRAHTRGVRLTNTGRYPSGQRGQTVNLLHLCFRGSNPLLPIKFFLIKKKFNGTKANVAQRQAAQ